MHHYNLAVHCWLCWNTLIHYGSRDPASWLQPWITAVAWRATSSGNATRISTFSSSNKLLKVTGHLFINKIAFQSKEDHPRTGYIDTLCHYTVCLRKFEVRTASRPSADQQVNVCPCHLPRSARFCCRQTASHLNDLIGLLFTAVAMMGWNGNANFRNSDSNSDQNCSVCLPQHFLIEVSVMLNDTIYEFSAYRYASCVIICTI